MHLLAAEATPSALGIWAYLALFVAAAVGYMGIPVIGTAVIGLAAVLASQGRLNIVAVLAVAAIGCEVGGLGGYGIGDHWGRQLLERPGPGLAWRTKAIAKGEDVYRKWGRAAVFVTPSIVSGVLAMKLRQFAVWNFLAGTVFVVAVGSGAYGVGRVSTGHHDPVSWGMLVGGTAVTVACVLLVRRHHRRHNARAGQPASRAAAGSSSSRDTGP
jgi:membrane protein DedA with SNARE-associated domain